MCWSAAWLVQALVWIVVLCAILAVIWTVLPIVLGWLGQPGEIALRIFKILVTAVVIVLLIYLAYDVLSCLGGVRVSSG
jgi:hypothetical protein